jgi:molybdenum cofactor cytidylyltransferase/nicotine blue oxidoreductase
MAQATGIVLAAGSGSRMGTPKAELVVDGIRLLDRAVAALTAAGCRYVVAVVRAGVEVGGARAVINPQPSRGMRSSLQLGLDAAAEFGSDDIAVLLVDTPGVGAVAIRTVLNGVRPGRIAVGTYNGRRGHPTVMSVALWRRALELAGPEEGGRALLRAQPELVDEIAADGDPIDLDTPDDLNAWTGRAGVPAPFNARPER